MGGKGRESNRSRHCRVRMPLPPPELAAAARYARRKDFLTFGGGVRLFPETFAVRNFSGHSFAALAGCKSQSLDKG